MKDTQLSVSPLTVRRYLHQVGIVYKKFRQQIALSKRHRILRKEAIVGWIREHIDWFKVVFSDEKRFCQDGPDKWCSFVPKMFQLLEIKDKMVFEGLWFGEVFANGTVISILIII